MAYFGVSGIGAVCESEFPELASELDAEPRSVHRCYQKLKMLRNQRAALGEEIEPDQVGDLPGNAAGVEAGRVLRHLPGWPVTAQGDPAANGSWVYNASRLQ